MSLLVAFLLVNIDDVLFPLCPISASNLLMFQFALDVWCDPQFCSTPQSIHFTGEVFGELGGLDHQQGFVVGVCRRGAPIEGSRDHGLVVDHGELVVQLVATGEAGGTDALYLQWF